MAEAGETERGGARDGLEPAGVAAGRVWLGVAAVFALLAFALGATLLFTITSIHGSATARARAFPAPALETSVAPRMVADRDHGPKPYRELPADERASRLGEADAALASAERALVDLGPRAYDPPPAAAGRP